MKKTFLVAALGFAISATSAFAADNTGTVMGGAVATTDCSLLSEDVNINLSANVFGAYACNTADNVIAVATCHPNGRKGAVQVACDPVANPAATPPYTPPAGCALRANPANPNDGVMTVQGGLAFTASTSGGSVQGANAENCVTGGNTTAEAEDAAGL